MLVVGCGYVCLFVLIDDVGVVVLCLGGFVMFFGVGFFFVEVDGFHVGIGYVLYGYDFFHVFCMVLVEGEVVFVVIVLSSSVSSDNR